MTKSPATAGIIDRTADTFAVGTVDFVGDFNFALARIDQMILDLLILHNLSFRKDKIGHNRFNRLYFRQN